MQAFSGVEPPTIFIIRETMQWLDFAFREYVLNIPSEQIHRSKRWEVELKDGTRIIGMTWQQESNGGTRGYSNVQYR